MFKRIFVIASIVVFSFIAISCKQATSGSESTSEKSTKNIYGVPYADPIEKDFSNTTWKAVTYAMSQNFERDGYVQNTGHEGYLIFKDDNSFDYCFDGKTDKDSIVKYEYKPDNNNCFTIKEIFNAKTNTDFPFNDPEWQNFWGEHMSEIPYIFFPDSFNIYYSFDGEKETITLLYHSLNILKHTTDDNVYLAGYDSIIYEKEK